MTLRQATWLDFSALVAGHAPQGLRLPEGEPIEVREVLAMLAALADEISERFVPAGWLVLDGDELVGLASLVRMPAEGAICIGYGIAPCRRGLGLAGKAVAEILDWARTDDRVASVLAETSVDNPASQAVLVRNGFTESGRREDPEDGALICWRVDTVGGVAT